MKQLLVRVGSIALGAMATGTLLLLALPLGEQSYLAWVMLIPLLIATKERGLLYGFLGGLGAVFWCALLATTGIVYHYKNWEGPTAWTYTACGIFAASFSLFFGIYAEKENHKRPVLWLAALAVFLESLLLFQIPAHLALTQYRNWLMMVVAQIGGIWMVSYLVWLANVYVAQDFRKRYWIGGLIVFASLFVTQFDPFRHPANEGITVGVAQITDGKDKELIKAQTDAARSIPAFVVWPEFAGMLFSLGDDTRPLKNLSKQTAPIITSYRDTFQPLPHNVAALFAKGEESARYEKRKLFGSETKMHTPGTKAVAVPLVGTGGNVGLNICYDSCFPAIIRESASLPDVKILALPTIDPDSSHYFMAAMHAAYTPFRAAESGVAMARADGNFGSMIVNEHGAIVAELKNEQQAITTKVSGNRVWTPYRMLGDWFLVVCIILTFLPVAKRLWRFLHQSMNPKA